MQLGSMFISNCNNTLHVSDAPCVKHQRLLLQFLSAPEDGRKERPKHVEYYCSY